MKSGLVPGCLPKARHHSPPHPPPLQPKSQCPASVEQVPPGPLSLGEAVRLGFLPDPFLPWAPPPTELLFLSGVSTGRAPGEE